MIADRLRPLFLCFGAVAVGVALWICHGYNEGEITFDQMTWRAGVLIASVLVLAAVAAVVEYGPGFGTWTNRYRHGFAPILRNDEEQ